jgi:hypothetical protein
VAHPQIAAFARLANGDAKATRQLGGQNSLITRTIHDFAYNPVRDEIVLPQYFAQAIMTYRGGANGEEAPIRVIRGPDTQITNPQRLALDPVHNEVFVPLDDQILVFPSLADGNVAPIRVLKGPDTLLGADAITVDPVHNLLIVAGPQPRGRVEAGASGVAKGQVLIFNRTDSGNVKPRAVIAGPKTNISRPWLMANYPPKELFVLTVTTPERNSPANFVGVWSEHDNGDAPPRWTIGGPNQLLRQVRGIALIPESKDVVVSDKYVNAVMTYHFPEMF